MGPLGSLQGGNTIRGERVNPVLRQHVQVQEDRRDSRGQTPAQRQAAQPSVHLPDSQRAFWVCQLKVGQKSKWGLHYEHKLLVSLLFKGLILDAAGNFYTAEKVGAGQWESFFLP